MLVFSNLRAQVPEVIEPSVNAKQFFQYNSSQIDLATGNVSVNIPLYELSGNSISLPISLHFNGKNVTYTSEASNVGLGWSLLAGGVITKTIRDFPDDLNKEANWSERTEAKYKNGIINQLYQDEIYSQDAINSCDQGLSILTNFDSEPDDYSYSFAGHSGSIIFNHNKEEDGLVATLYPDKTFKIERTAQGFVITNDLGVRYLFEDSESIMNTDVTISWFLTKIIAQNGDSISLSYSDDFYDIIDTWYGPNLILDVDVNNSNPVYVPSYSNQQFPSVYRSKRITKIESEYAYVTFTAAEREDMVSSWGHTSKRITNIDVFTKDNVKIKGFRLDNDHYFLSEERDLLEYRNKRLKLESIQEYNSDGKLLPPYKFYYDSFFEWTKRGKYYWPTVKHPMPRDSWATPVLHSISFDRDFNGNPTPFIVEVPDPYGSSGGNFEIDHVVNGVENLLPSSDYFCIGELVLPSGGSERYEYENHDYSFYGPSDREKSYHPSYYPFHPKGHNQEAQVTGKRIKRKFINDGKGNIKTIDYKYILHDDNDYSRKIFTDLQGNEHYISSGVLMNPAFHYATMYTPVFKAQVPEKSRLNASIFFSGKPLNSSTGMPLVYAEVEQIINENLSTYNGKVINYFSQGSMGAGKYSIYLNYEKFGAGISKDNILVSFPRTQIYGDPLSEYPYERLFLPYPLGRLGDYTYMAGKLIKQVTIDADNNLIKKEVNEYFSQVPEYAYGISIARYDDWQTNNADEYPPIFDNPEPDKPDFDLNRYVINEYRIPFGTMRLDKSTTTRYYGQDSVVNITIYDYFSRYDYLRSVTKIKSDEDVFITKYRYPLDFLNVDEVNLNYSFDIASGAILEMLNKNMVGMPIETIHSKGSTITGAELFNYRVDDNLILGNSIMNFNFRSSPVQGFSESSVTVSDGKYVFNSNSNYEEKYLFKEYDKKGNLLEYNHNESGKVSLIYGYNNSLIIAKVVNAANSDIAFNDFEEAKSTGGWSLTNEENAVINSEGLTGEKAILIDDNSIFSKLDLNPDKTYNISFRAKKHIQGSSLLINEVSIAVNNNDYKYHHLTVGPGVNSVTVRATSSNKIYLDELRLYPNDALMTTFTHDPLIGMTSQTDPNGIITYYEYDDFGRLKMIKDNQEKVVETYKYNYKTSGNID